MDIAPLSLIIVPLDGSVLAERALKPAEELAARSGTAVLLLSSRFGPDDGSSIQSLRRIAASLTVPSEVAVIEDRLAHNAILDAANAKPGALVVMGTHGRGGAGQMLLGSTAEEVVRHLDQPVLLVGPECSPSWSIGDARIIVCSDGSELSAAIASSVAFLTAQIDDSQLSIVQVVADEARAHTQTIEDAMAACHLTATTQVIHGDDPIAAITELARTLPAAFIAMATHGHSGLQRLILGSTSAAMIRRAPCPVLVARPHDFFPSADS